MKLILILFIALSVAPLGRSQREPDKSRILSSYFCQRRGCSQGCQVTETGKVECSCMQGFQLQSDGVSCFDIDECTSQPGLCEHNCTNTAGSYICTCPPRHSLRDDGRTCRPFDDYSESPCADGGSQSPCSPNGKIDPEKPVNGISPVSTHSEELRMFQRRQNNKPCTTEACNTLLDNRENRHSQAGHKEDTDTDTHASFDKEPKSTISSKDRSNFQNNIEDTFEEGHEVQNGNLPCLGGGCELGNLNGILVDCTGSGCPPRDKTWYQQFLGIPMPAHDYFERNRKQKLTGAQAGFENKRAKDTFESANRFFTVQDKRHTSSNVDHLATQNDRPLSDDPKCRDDLCIDENEFIEIPEEIGFHQEPSDKDVYCPPGYVQEKKRGESLCHPPDGDAEMEPEIQVYPELKCQEGEQLVRTVGREFCVPMKAKPFHRKLCPAGHIPIESDHGLDCVEIHHSTDGTCGDGLVPMDTLDGTVCVHPHIEKSQIPALDKKCGDDQVAMQTETGFICVDRIEPRPLCTSGMVPETRDGRVQCTHQSNCPPGSDVVVSDTGRKCQDTVTTTPTTTSTPTSKTEAPCPYGLVPLQTSVGRVCQYIPSSKTVQAPPRCQGGKLIKTKTGSFDCLHTHQSDHLECPKGQTLITTEHGQSCGFPFSKKGKCISGIYDKHGQCVLDIETKCQQGEVPVISPDGITCTPDVTNCPFGFIKVSGTCQDLNMNNLCPVGQELVERTDGFDCIYRNQVDPGHGTNVRECSSGEILSQAMRNFYCETHDVPSSEITTCEPELVVVKIGGGYACVTKFEASLQCSEREVLIQLPNGFSCLPTKATHTSKKLINTQCGPGEVHLTDEKGIQVCLSLDKASAACGEGYRAVKHGEDFVCRQERISVHCPEGFVLTFTDISPACVPELDLDCIPLANHLTPECINKIAEAKVPECETGYQVVEIDGTSECILQVTDDENCDVIDCDGEDCSKKGSVRPCDIDPEILLAGCNPDCANGGTCKNGTCICPLGIAGRACNEDVNECIFLQKDYCEFECVNTFGSFHCSCLNGMDLQTDRRTCKANYCTPDCLNGGECTNGRCRCSYGFTGNHCQTDINECDLYGERLCQHACRNTYGSYSCICPLGTRLNVDGRTCTNITCIHQCHNGGQCENNRCVCPPGFYGIICQLDINECYTDNPCSHSCVNLRGSYRCSCREGFKLQADRHTCEPTTELT